MKKSALKVIGFIKKNALQIIEGIIGYIICTIYCYYDGTGPLNEYSWLMMAIFSAMILPLGVVDNKTEKDKKLLGKILFYEVLFSPVVAICWSSVVGEAAIFSVAGIIEYSWVSFMFIPVVILSIRHGLKLKKENLSYKKNLIIAFICLPLIILFGSCRLVCMNYSYEVYKVNDVERKINLDLPRDIRTATVTLESYSISYVKINDHEQRQAFEAELESNDLWKSTSNTEAKDLLPLDVQQKLKPYEYFAFYNVTTGEYNTGSESGEYEAVYIAYDSDLHRLFIIDGYKVISD